MQLYAPFYLSNECINHCTYCGFNEKLGIRRKTLSLDEQAEGFSTLRSLGFDHVLLLTGEAPHLAGLDYLERSIRLAKTYFSQISLEIFPCDTHEYARLVASGANGLTLYQETYQRAAYGDFHPHGPKSNYLYRLDSADRALTAGFRKMGLGCLLGLSDWRSDIALCALHLSYLQKKYWRAELSMSFPRLQKNLQHFPVSDEDLLQIICATRLYLPTIHLVLSTRERSSFRDRLIRSGITLMSAGSKTNPGGYSDLSSASQFDISDQRSLSEISKMLREQGVDPVLRDWSCVF